MRRHPPLQPPTSPEHHGAAIVQLQSCSEQHEARLNSLDASVASVRAWGETIARLETAQKLHREDFQEALKDLGEELRYLRRTAFGILATLLCSGGLAILGIVLTKLVK